MQNLEYMYLNILPWSVPKLILELIQGLIQFILCDQVASIMTHLKHNKDDNYLIIFFTELWTIECELYIKVKLSVVVLTSWYSCMLCVRYV